MAEARNSVTFEALDLRRPRLGSIRVDGSHVCVCPLPMSGDILECDGRQSLLLVGSTLAVGFLAEGDHARCLVHVSHVRTAFVTRFSTCSSPFSF